MASASGLATAQLAGVRGAGHHQIAGRSIVQQLATIDSRGQAIAALQSLPPGRTTVAPLIAPITDRRPPVVAVDWPPGYIDPGSTLTIPVTVSDNVGITSLTMERFGVLSGVDGGLIVPARTEYTRVFKVTLPPQARPGTVLQLVVTAENERGFRRSNTRRFRISRAGEPTVVSTVPSAAAEGVSTHTTVTVAFSEPVANAKTELALSPAPPGDMRISYDEDNLTAVITPEAGLSPGTRYTVNFGDITDLAGNPLSPLSAPVTFTTVEALVSAPRLVKIMPANTSTGAPPSPVLEYTFNAAIAGPLPTGLMTITEDAPGALPIAVAETWLDGGRRYRATVPPSQLSPGTTYRTSFAGHTLQDSRGGVARDLQGRTMTEPFETLFTTAAPRVAVVGWTGVGPPHVVFGYPARVRIATVPGVEMERTEWRVDGAHANVADTIGRAPATTVEIPKRAPGTTVDLGATVQLGGGGTLKLPPTPATVESPTGDFDKDGINNGDEIRFGLDPWQGVDAAQDPDGDGRSNAQEVADGTDPFVDDSLGNRPPVAGVRTTQSRLLDISGPNYLDLPPAVQLESDFTWEMWVYLSGAGPVLSSGAPNGKDSPGVGIEYDGQDLLFTLTTSRSGAQSWSSFAPAGTWHHVALSYDGNRFAVYIDGIRRISAPASGPVVYSSNATRFGATLSGDTLAAGWLDEVRLWSLARSVRDIKLDLQRSLDGREAALFGYWRLDDGAGVVASNDSGFAGRDGKVNQNWATSPVRPGVAPPVISVGNDDTLLTLTALDLDRDTITWTLESLPSNGALFETAEGGSRGAQITTVPFELTSEPDDRVLLLFQPTPGYLGTNTVSFRVSDGTDASRLTVVRLDSIVDKTWTGATSNDWHEPMNWNPVGVPDASDSVRIPSGTAPITLSANAEAGALYVGFDTAVEMGAFNLSIDAGLFNNGALRGTSGELRFVGTRSSVRGQVPTTTALSAALSLSGDTHVAGDLTAAAGLSLEGRDLRVDGATTINRFVDVGAATAEIDSEGTLSFGTAFSGISSVNLTGGTIRAAGNLYFYMSSGGVYDHPGPCVLLDGNGSQFISGVPSATEFFVLNAGGEVALGDVEVSGSVTIASGATVNSGTLTVAENLKVGRNAVVTVANLTTADVIAQSGALVTAKNLEVASSTALTQVVFTNLTIPVPLTLVEDVSLPGNLELTMTGGLLVDSGVTLNVGGQLSVPRDAVLTSAGNLRVGGTASISGTFTQTEGVVDFDGSLLLGNSGDCSAAQDTLLTGGKIYAAGAVNLFACSNGGPGVIATPAHTLVLDGTITQSLNVDRDEIMGGPNRLGSVEIRNVSEQGVEIQVATVAGTLHLIDTAIVRPPSDFSSTVNVLGDIQLGTSSSFEADELSLHGQILGVSGASLAQVDTLRFKQGARYPWELKVVSRLFLESSLIVTQPLAVPFLFVKAPAHLMVPAGQELAISSRLEIDPDAKLTVQGNVRVDDDFDVTGAPK